ncbi:hypothetical protein [Desulfotomaculum copahuensis]|uniref:Uncharacterized protein n=1 Tax=Desulfotomaculum copahuensis TaxID=1838280 RepID=A0A1B7LE38_9FIRM|nr:hypothetical protein [Desulfotomaculum copahuensis]OAT81368.1 hypothetical protein A6M21_10835 [Desulfotomaculum copahuensis]
MPENKKRPGGAFAGSVLVLVPFFFLLSMTGGCSSAQSMPGYLLRSPVIAGDAQSNQTAGTQPGQPSRFEIIYEHGETKNLGGFTVIRDNATGQEYLAVIGLNGSSSVIAIKSPPAPGGAGTVR